MHTDTHTSLSKLAVIALACAAAASGLFLGWALLYSNTAKEVSLTYGGVTRTLLTKAETVDELLDGLGVQPSLHDRLSHDAEEVVEEGMHLTMRSAFPVAVASRGEVTILHMLEGSVGEALALAGIEYAAQDEVTELPFADVTPGMHIRHIDVEIDYQTTTEVIEYKEEVIRDENKYKTEAPVVKSVGENGEKLTVRRLVYKDGELASREIMNQIILKEPVDEVTIVGARTRFQTGLTGDTREWKAKPTSAEIAKTLVATEVTAYTHTGRRTATGKWPRVGYVAVNPNVIPYGTRLYIPGYGYCTAQDTGAFRLEEGGMKNQIDLFMETAKECKKWGRKRNVTIYVLK